ncbi:MAG TPA: pantoate--beta-alanine ligase, partial [Acidimicrobiia bacterium]|nr:pantoate--beta-alanine ligase [Acidimicrobiia bacterium]
MKTLTTRQELAAALAAERRGLVPGAPPASRRSIGFVPTMGALHQGHVSLIEAARAADDVVVVSIFVNPLQFGPTEDFDRYPRDLATDARVAADAGADYLFAPSVAEMYPAGATATRVEVGPIGEGGEGRYRPGFFAGVATVCVKLFSIVGPDRAYFGQKDAQQLAVIRQVVADLNLPLQIVACPTVRETDGLAVSSRNAYLDPEGRRAAPALARALRAAQHAAAAGEDDAAALTGIVAEALAAEPAVRLQYATVFDPETFAELPAVGECGAVLAAAAHVGSTRLIDNVALVVHPAAR